MSGRHTFTEAFERLDAEAMAAAISPDVVFHSPVLGKAGPETSGRELALEVFGLVFQRVSTPTDIVEFQADDGGYVVGFDAAIDGHPLQALMLITEDSEGRVDSISPHLRPYPLVTLLREHMMAHMCPDPIPPEFWVLAA
jgi:hypothetical protein